MTPAEFLSILLCITAAAAVMDLVRRRRRSRVLRRLAADWRMNYTPVDSLHITPTIARSFPVPGAAALRVRDLIYGIQGERYRYVFTAEFTTGVVGVKHRTVRVAAFSEPRHRGASAARSGDGGASGDLRVAEPTGSLLDQYARLAPTDAGALPNRSGDPGVRGAAGSSSITEVG